MEEACSRRVVAHQAGATSKWRRQPQQQLRRWQQPATHPHPRQEPRRPLHPCARACESSAAAASCTRPATEAGALRGQVHKRKRTVQMQTHRPLRARRGREHVPHKCGGIEPCLLVPAGGGGLNLMTTIGGQPGGVELPRPHPLPARRRLLLRELVAVLAAAARAKAALELADGGKRRRAPASDGDQALIFEHLLHHDRCLRWRDARPQAHLNGHAAGVAQLGRGAQLCSSSTSRTVHKRIARLAERHGGNALRRSSASAPQATPWAFGLQCNLHARRGIWRRGPWREARSGSGSGARERCATA